MLAWLGELIGRLADSVAGWLCSLTGEPHDCWGTEDVAPLSVSQSLSVDEMFTPHYDVWPA